MSDCLVKPFRDFLVVEKVKAMEQISAGGLVMPATSTSDSKFASGKVLAVGSGTVSESGKVVPCEVKVGDTVFFLKSLSVDLTVEGTDYYLLREEHCMCKV